MAALIDGLLTLSRVTRSEISRETVDLGAIARGVVAQLRRSAPDRAVEAVIAADLTAQGDARLMRGLYENLLGNAWKFTRHRSLTKIEVGAVKDNGDRVYFVRDNGAGFDMAYAGKLFGAFQRLHSTAEFEGTGIGLATVRRIVNRHGGRVWAEGAVGAGATFYFTLTADAPEGATHGD
jgi:light-regulated signal transduction histidine kinase (bacteriophytochrome)